MGQALEVVAAGLDCLTFPAQMVALVGYRVPDGLDLLKRLLAGWQGGVRSRG